MKEYIIIAIILIIIIGGGIYAQNYLQKTTEKLVEGLDEIKEKIDISNNIKELSEDYDKVYQEWEKIKEKWSVIVLHDEIDEIEKYLNNTKSSIDCNDKNEAKRAINIVIFAINHIYEKEKLSLINVF